MDKIFGLRVIAILNIGLYNIPYVAIRCLWRAGQTKRPNLVDILRKVMLHNLKKMIFYSRRILIANSLAFTLTFVSNNKNDKKQQQQQQ